ncbi:ubiquitin-binding protein cue5 [Lithohypha guttulata]|nr:ubiquitin-binding protein cue5 [Lithohypha guttulata]
MADNMPKKQDSPVSPIRSTEGQPESPTTAQPLDFDDDDNPTAHNPTRMSATETTSKPEPPPKDEHAPAKPPRPMNPKDQAIQTLREAFPTIDVSVIRAILTASGGNIEPAFAALLEMSDPEAAQREQPPTKPPRPTQQPAQMSQLEADEQYARHLAEQYEHTRTSSRPTDRYNSNLPGSRPGRPGAHPNPDDPEYHWRSFIDGAGEFRKELNEAANEIWTDDLPEIRDNLRKGFFETQKTVTSWISNFKKNFEEKDEDVDYTAQNTAQNRGQPQARRSGESARRSAEYSRYDADPQVIGDDFSKLNLKDGDHPPRTSSRPTANPNLFKSDQRSSSKGVARKVSFQDGPPEEIKDMYSASPKPATTNVQTTGTAASGKSSKWQPLSAVDPSPVGDNDPFSLGDSDDEKDAKPITLKDDEVGKGKIDTAASVPDVDSKKATVEDEKK